MRPPTEEPGMQGWAACGGMIGSGNVAAANGPGAREVWRHPQRSLEKGGHGRPRPEVGHVQRGIDNKWSILIISDTIYVFFPFLRVDP